MKRLTNSLFLGAVAACFATSPAAATGSGLYAIVSGLGTDASGCGQPLSPCRTAQYAFSYIVAAGGQILIKDAAGYQPIYITSAISIISDGGGVGGFTTIGDTPAITVAAGQLDTVILKGLAVSGYGASSTTGILVKSGKDVVIDDCAIHGMLNSSASAAGVVVRSDATKVQIINSQISGNFYGIQTLSSSTEAVPVVDVLVSNSTVSGNNVGIITGANTSVTIEKSDISGNARYGVSNSASAILQISGSNFGDTVTGINNSGVLDSYGDNIFPNVGGYTISGNPAIAVSKQ